jgi:RecA/RadA recombinase
MSLMEKLMKAGSVKQSSILADSPFFNEKDCIPTKLPILNLAFSGSLDGGLVPGLTIFAGLSKSFKTLLGLYCMKAYFDKYPSAISLVYDSEFGITPEYLKSIGIDTERVIHIPVEHVEELKFDVMKRLKEIERDDKVFIMIDSLGALASKKEVEDAMSEKSVADMTRAKSIRSLLRMITPHLTMKDIPCIVINHIYQTMELYSKAVVGGGTAVMYSANQIFIISKSQEKDGEDLVGWNFTISIEKSRFVKERSRLPFTVTFEGGIDPFSGLFELALEAGVLESPTKGWYVLKGTDKKFRAKDTNSQEFWKPILADADFRDFLTRKFSVSSGKNMVSKV